MAKGLVAIVPIVLIVPIKKYKDYETCNKRTDRSIARADAT